MRSVPFQRLSQTQTIFGIFAGDLDMDRYFEVTSMVYTCIVTFPKSTKVVLLMTFNDVICHFSSFCAPGVIYCTDFEFGIRFSFISVEIGSLGS